MDTVCQFDRTADGQTADVNAKTRPIVQDILDVLTLRRSI
jgi:hypothetical protein